MLSPGFRQRLATDFYIVAFLGAGRVTSLLSQSMEGMVVGVSREVVELFIELNTYCIVQPVYDHAGVIGEQPGHVCVVEEVAVLHQIHEDGYYAANCLLVRAVAIDQRAG